MSREQRTDTERLDWLQKSVRYHASFGEDREAVAGFVDDIELEARLIDAEGDLRTAIDTAMDAAALPAPIQARTRAEG